MHKNILNYFLLLLKLILYLSCILYLRINLMIKSAVFYNFYVRKSINWVLQEYTSLVGINLKIKNDMWDNPLKRIIEHFKNVTLF